MPRKSIADTTRCRVEERDCYRCAYCRTPQAVSAVRVQIDHIMPRALQGSDEEDSLCLACASCNGHKRDRVEAADPMTGERVPLFNPNRQRWLDHFAWAGEGILIRGKTPCGRATVEALRMDNPNVVGARSLWAQIGWWPPED